MASNPIRSSKILPLRLDDWVKAYAPLSNWPVNKWLQFQTLESGRLQDGLLILHDFQKTFGIVEPTIQQDMLQWLSKATVWDQSSLSSWKEWGHILKATSNWSLPVQSKILTEHGAKHLRVEPEQYDVIANIQDHFGRYWNQVHSRIPTYSNVNRRSIQNTNTPWETYNTFRRELSKGQLLDHPDGIRWMDFDRLSKTPSSWRKVLTPLYHDWLCQLSPTSHIEGTDFQTWLHAFEENGLDASKVALPIFPDSYAYRVWSIPGSWKDSDAEASLDKVRYLDKAAAMYLDGNEYDEYPQQMLEWIQNACTVHMHSWSLEQRLEINNVFLLSAIQYNYFRFGSSKGTVHELFLRWLPEYTEQFTGVKNAMDALGMDSHETTTDYRGRPQREYTAKSAKRDMEHYTNMLHHFLTPSPVSATESLGHLFDSDDSALLGI